MSRDHATSTDTLGIGVRTPLPDTSHGTTHWRIDRWDADQTAWVARRSLCQPQPYLFHLLGVKPYLTTELVGNLVTNAGWTRLMNLATNQGGTQALDATHTRIGVGNGTTPAEGYGDTDLAASAGSSNRWFQPVSGAGTLGTRTLSFSATFGTSDGNFAWNEFGLDVTSSTATAGNTVGALLLNHKVGIAQGTKASGQTWTATATLTFT